VAPTLTGMQGDGRVKLRDVREVGRLVAGCGERWADARSWRRHLLRGVQRMFGAPVVILVEGGGVDVSGKPRHIELASAGWPSARAQRRFREYLEMGGPAMMPDFRLIARRVDEQGHYTGRRRDHVPDRHWYASEAYQRYNAASGIDDYVVSMHRLPWLGTTSSLSVHQRVDGEPFSPRHRRLLALLHAELAPRLGRKLCLRRQHGWHRLTKRQRQTLRLLLNGDGEKQVAATLGIRQTTVHGYVGELYRCFQVSGRAELLSYFIHQRPRPSPQALRRRLTAKNDDAGR